MEGLDFVRIRFPLFMFRSGANGAGLCAEIRAHGVGLSAAVWDWRKGRFDVGTWASYWSCRVSFEQDRCFFL